MIDSGMRMEMLRERIDEKLRGYIRCMCVCV